MIPYIDFIKDKPILKGRIGVNGKVKYGYFKPEFNRYSNNIDYQYYTPKMKKGKGGFTLYKAYCLLQRNILELNKD